MDAIAIAVAAAAAAVAVGQAGYVVSSRAQTGQPVAVTAAAVAAPEPVVIWLLVDVAVATVAVVAPEPVAIWLLVDVAAATVAVEAPEPVAILLVVDVAAATVAAGRTGRDFLWIAAVARRAIEDFPFAECRHSQPEQLA